jgi:ketosteroid isomerase-like protein
MNKKVQIKTILLAVTILLPFCALADDWSKEQKEVLKFEEACISAKSADDLIGCFHEDFVGWGLGSTIPTSKSDRIKGIVDRFENSDSEPMLFKPVSVIVKGNMAIVSYVDSSKSTDKTTKEVEYSTQRWTDVCLKEGGKWYWISDHGVDISGS